MATEQEVRTRAGWIGVEISRSRVRTPGKAGYGLYRVRTAAERHWHVPHPVVTPAGSWTAYAFTLEEIETEIAVAIEGGVPAHPSALILRPADASLCDLTVVSTRWTSAYGGRRDLGCVSVVVRPGYAAELDALVALIDAGLVVMEHEDGWCGCEGTTKLTARCVRRTLIGLPSAMTLRCQNETEPEGEQCRGTVRSRQREQNREFQAVHKVARDYGLKKRHAAKLARLSNSRTRPAERPVGGLEGPSEGVGGGRSA